MEGLKQSGLEKLFALSRQELIMGKSIEIYIRQSAGENLLNIYVPSELRETFIHGTNNGAIEKIGAPINFEMSLASESKRTNEPLHVSLKIKSINIMYTD